MSTEQGRMSGPDRLRLEVRARRQALRMTQAGVSQAGGPSHESVRLIERGARDTYRDLTLSQLDVALRWRPGTAKSLLHNKAGADSTAWELDRTAAPTGAGGTEALPLSLDTVSDIDLAAELVSRLAGRADPSDGNDRLRQLLTLLAQWSAEDDPTTHRRAS